MTQCDATCKVRTVARFALAGQAFRNFLTADLLAARTFVAAQQAPTDSKRDHNPQLKKTSLILKSQWHRRKPDVIFFATQKLLLTTGNYF
jgi:hypothetical protein